MQRAQPPTPVPCTTRRVPGHGRMTGFQGLQPRAPGDRGTLQLACPALGACSGVGADSPTVPSRVGVAVASAAAGWPSSRGQRWSSMRLLWNLLSRSKKHSSSEDGARGMLCGPGGQSALAPGQPQGGPAVPRGPPDTPGGCSAQTKVRTLLSRPPRSPSIVLPDLSPASATAPSGSPSASPDTTLVCLPSLAVTTTHQQPPCAPGPPGHSCLLPAVSTTRACVPLEPWHPAWHSPPSAK